VSGELAFRQADFVPRDHRILWPVRQGNCPELLFPRPIVPAADARPLRPLRHRNERQTEVRTMLSWVITFLVIALIAGVLGFGGIAGASIEMAKIVFFIAVVLFLVSAVVGLARGRTRV
jgi:uncharacterized membrane protein YtjA (UPF0391 family)